LVSFLLFGVSLATQPPADYRAHLHSQVALNVSQLAAQGQTQQALDLASMFSSQVEPAAPISYEVGLLYNRLGDMDLALTHYNEALKLNPNSAPARYDRGEIHLLRGELDRAEEDLVVAATLSPEHWAVHMRLAELTALQNKPNEMEAHLLAALREGLDLSLLTTSPKWKVWANDDVLGPKITRIILVYGGENVLDQLRSP